MAESLFEFGWQPAAEKDDKIYGVAIATVIDNIDSLGEARVQVSLPWAPGFEPWARIATMMAGMERGSFFIPQVGDEVLVGFNHGDIREPFILGALWNTLDRPPALLPTDAVNKRIIRTPLGQQITFDDAEQSITISNLLQFQLSLGPEESELASAGASVSLDIAGNVTITGAAGITLQAPSITIDGENVSISGSAGVTVDGGADCTILAGEINIG
ncbi:MAG: type IV secretion protein Rhs [Alphaproteobacteria bacterium]|nr:type IV secretion protein Rhs [Alphaproteobacteria bacterium]MBV9377933.1 type IV secretion protein Rhs [Alphaproteobacteria bacterium]